jgi:hypothetical protein
MRSYAIEDYMGGLVGKDCRQSTKQQQKYWHLKYFSFNIKSIYLRNKKSIVVYF